MSSHTLFLLAFLTFFLIPGFPVWNRMAVHRNQVTDRMAAAAPNDPTA